jgi:uncharacterized membrane protein
MRWFLPGKPGSASLMLDRLNALSDGVIAIVLTLLVLGIDIPKDHDFSQDGLLSFVMKIEYQVTVYAISFVLIGTYWIAQSVMFHYFRQGSRTLTWLNLLFLFVLTLLPFLTDLIGTYRNEPLVMVIYGAVNIACCLSLALMWWYANHVAPVVWPRIDPAVARSMALRILMGAGVSLAVIAVSFVNVRLAHLVFLTMPFLYVSHRRVDAHWSEVVDKDEVATGGAG